MVQQTQDHCIQPPAPAISQMNVRYQNLRNYSSLSVERIFIISCSAHVAKQKGKDLFLFVVFLSDFCPLSPPAVPGIKNITYKESSPFYGQQQQQHQKWGQISLNNCKNTSQMHKVLSERREIIIMLCFILFLLWFISLKAQTWQ